uniref:B30.2/SPRY domain-containing protein n=1 Tax=Astyanax mexicanus TaxID=7994 RepID=A0A8B9HS42_ASTMX
DGSQYKPIGNGNGIDACDLTLDPNTAHTLLSLSDGNRKVRCVKGRQLYPDHPDRFDCCKQVLSAESLTGRHYWEVEWGGISGTVAISYGRIQRKGDSEDCWFGYNNHSWTLNCCDKIFSVWHNNKKTAIPVHPSDFHRVGVYLDWTAGTLSFYLISPDTHTLTHLHTFKTCFTEPLYAGFWIDKDSFVSLCV